MNQLVRVISLIIDNHASYIEVKDMAERVHLSVSQLQRDFLQNFGIAPSRYPLSARSAGGDGQAFAGEQ